MQTTTDNPTLLVITAAEAAKISMLSRNALTDAIRRGALPARRSGRVWLVSIEDLLRYQGGRHWPHMWPEELKPALDAALAHLADET